jgi:hypothetical protein
VATPQRRLHVALQDGFEEEPVLVRLDDEEVYSGQAVRTDQRIGLADSFEHPVAAVSTRVEVRLPRRELGDAFEVNVVATPYVGISVLDGAVVWRPSNEPFGYV